AGDFFGEMALLHDIPRTATVTAVTPCAIHELSREQLQGWMQAYPNIGKALAEADREHQAHQQQVAAGGA
ncbi:MAG: cyclic nucleotide-binding domain-containing protein, partial [Hydrogenophilaceae bacterium]